MVNTRKSMLEQETLKKAKCAQPGHWNCDIAHIDRVMPDYEVFDGSHRYNMALSVKKLFPQAYLVLGFSSASPNEEIRVRILEAALKDAAKSLDLRSGQSALELIVNPETPTELRKTAIIALRNSWEARTYQMNRGRPSGSITPAFPDIDKGYVMSLHQLQAPQLHGKYTQE